MKFYVDSRRGILKESMSGISYEGNNGIPHYTVRDSEKHVASVVCKSLLQGRKGD